MLTFKKFYLVNFTFILLLVVLSVFGLERNASCQTPNSESAKCISVNECKPILTALQTQNKSAIDFAVKSQCGYDADPLVCCGTTGYPAPKKTNIFDIFTKAPPVPPRASDQSVILNDFQTTKLPDRSVCGLEKEANRVLGGDFTEIGEFPWMAALEYRSKFTKKNAGIRCGGTILNNRFILTAAHCIIDNEFELISVWLGEWNIATEKDCQTFVAIRECSDDVLKLKIKDQIPHPYYTKRTANNDLGLLRLERDIQFTDYIRPICLPPINLPPPAFYTLMTVAGWGANENGTSSEIKMKVDVPVLSNQQCADKFSGRAISANQLCAGGEQGKDSCQGDSGGPLMRLYSDKINTQNQWYQEGVVSRGVGCGRAGYPAIYTRVSRYVNWIVNIISEDS